MLLLGGKFHPGTMNLYRASLLETERDPVDSESPHAPALLPQTLPLDLVRHPPFERRINQERARALLEKPSEHLFEQANVRARTTLKKFGKRFDAAEVKINRVYSHTLPGEPAGRPHNRVFSRKRIRLLW